MVGAGGQAGGDPAERGVDLDTLFRDHYPGAARLAGLLLGDFPAGEEVAQEAFARLLQPGRAIEDPPAYLRATVVNLARSRLRRAVLARRHARELPRDAPGPEEATEALAARIALRHALRRLPARQREAVVLRYYAGLTEAEVARAMGVSLGAAKTHLHRARAALAPTLEGLR